MVPRLLCSILIVCVLVLTGAQAARAVPQDLTQAKDQAVTLEAQLKELKDQAAALRATYQSATSKLAETQADAADNAAALVQAQEDQTNAETALRERLTHIYKQGRSSSLNMLLSSSSLPEFLDRLTLLQRVSKQDADLLDKVTAYREQVAEQGLKLADRLTQEQIAASQVEAARKAMADKLAQAQTTLKDKQAEVAQLTSEWKAQLAEQVRLEKERQAKLQAALDAAQAAAQNGGGDSGGNGGGSTTTTTVDGTHSTTSTTSGSHSTTSTTSGGSQAHGTVNILKPAQIALVAKKAGFSGSNLVIAVAVAMSESNSNADAIGNHTYGLWQILSYAHPSMIDPVDPEASRWYDPYVNAGFAWSISSHGTNWRPWAVYTSGAYQHNMASAQAGVDLLLSDPGAVTPPTVK